MERIRKQVYELTRTDLIQYPIWEYALDEEGYEGQDEKTVRPYFGSMPFDPSKTYGIIRANFIFADGTHMKGYIKPIVDNNRILAPVLPYDYAPTIVTEDKQLPLCYGTFRPTTKRVKEFYKLLGKKSGEVFPTKFISDTDVYGKMIAGNVEGLMYFDEGLNFFHVKVEDIKTIG